MFYHHPKNATSNFIYAYHKPMGKLKEEIYFWKIESNDVDEYEPRGIPFNETEEKHIVEMKDSDIISLDYGRLIKINKHNIGT
jgi:hypothetical protein